MVARVGEVRKEYGFPEWIFRGQQGGVVGWRCYGLYMSCCVWLRLGRVDEVNHREDPVGT